MTGDEFWAETERLEAQLAVVTAELAELKACPREVGRGCYDCRKLEAVTAERDDAQQKADYWLKRAMGGAEAQVAALREALIGVVGTPRLGVGQVPSKTQIDGARQALATPSPAADRLLAAQAVAEACARYEATECGIDELRVAEALEAWRKAGKP